MTILGSLFMIVSLAFVWGLAIWCYKQVLTGPDDGGDVKPPDSLGG